MDSSVDFRDKNVENWSSSKRQDYSFCGAKPGENIMPVELAIKRELAYRKRITMLRSQTLVGTRDAPMSSKGPSSSQNLVGMKRKEPSCNFKCLPQLSSICQPLQKQSVRMNSKLVLNLNRCTRLGGYKKVTKRLDEDQLKGLKENQEYIRHKGDQLWCSVCNVPCSCEYSLVQHFVGKKHADCIETMKNANCEKRN